MDEDDSMHVPLPIFYHYNDDSAGCIDIIKGRIMSSKLIYKIRVVDDSI